MKFVVGCLAATGLILASAAQAQVLPPMRGDVRVSDFEEPGPYGSMPPPRIYVPGPRYGDGYAPSVLPPHEIYAVIREAGFSPLGAPQQRGLVYTVAAIDRRGEDGRMVIDARTGRILRFMPAYQMGDRMNQEVVSRYGPPAAMPELPQYRRPPFDPKAANAAGATLPAAAPAPANKQKVASQTATVPLPKAPPAKAVATPAKPVAIEKPPVMDKPIAEKPAEPVATPAPEPVQQSAVTETKPAEVTAPEAPAATPPAEKTETPPTVAPPVVEAKPETSTPTDDKPAVVKGLE